MLDVGCIMILFTTVLLFIALYEQVYMDRETASVKLLVLLQMEMKAKKMSLNCLLLHAAHCLSTVDCMMHFKWH